MSSKKKNKDNDIVVSFLGASKSGVTGSCVSVSYTKNDGTKGLVILECGLPQGEPTIEKQYQACKKMLEGIGKEIVEHAEYILLGHQHIDHIGNLPYFSDDNGFKGRVLGSAECIEIGKQLLKDSVYIHSKNVEYLLSQGKKVKPLYTEKEMYQVISRMEHVPISKNIVLNENLTVVFHPNSHVIGATSISLIITTKGNRKKHILYSSDMGSNLNRDLQPFLREMDIPKKCTVFISEATYNNSSRSYNRQDCIKEREELKKLIKDSINANKRILFATFSFSRGQYLLSLLHDWFEEEEWFQKVPIVCDGLLINNINSTYLNILEGEERKYFEEVLSMRNLKFNKTYDCTLATLSKRTCGIYLAGSGFLTNGRITTYLPQFLGSSKDVIILTGYSGGEGSLASKILNEDQKTVTMPDKKVVLKRAEVHQLRTFSSHISYSELLDLWASMDCDKIIVHHSDDGKYKLIEEAKEYLSNKNRTTPIISLDKGSWQFVL